MATEVNKPFQIIGGKFPYETISSNIKANAENSSVGADTNYKVAKSDHVHPFTTLPEKWGGTGATSAVNFINNNSVCLVKHAVSVDSYIPNSNIVTKDTLVNNTERYDIGLGNITTFGHVALVDDFDPNEKKTNADGTLSSNTSYSGNYNNSSSSTDKNYYSHAATPKCVLNSYSMLKSSIEKQIEDEVSKLNTSITTTNNTLATKVPNKSVGSSKKLIYIKCDSSTNNTGVITESSSTIGTIYNPVYMNNGDITACNMVGIIPVVEKSSNYTVIDSDFRKIIAQKSGTVTVPNNMASICNGWNFFIINASTSNKITVTCSGCKFYDGTTSKTLSLKEGMHLFYSGSVWYVLDTTARFQLS